MRPVRLVAAMAVTVAAAVGVAACGSSDDDNSSSSGSATSTPAASSGGAKNGGKITLLMGTAPDYLDPQEAYTTQAVEATWISYLGLYTYAHKSGTAGGQVIP